MMNIVKSIKKKRIFKTRNNNKTFQLYYTNTHIGIYEKKKNNVKREDCL